MRYPRHRSAHATAVPARPCPRTTASAAVMPFPPRRTLRILARRSKVLPSMVATGRLVVVPSGPEATDASRSDGLLGGRPDRRVRTRCPAAAPGEGPGGREQPLALSPQQELAVGRRARDEVMAEYRGRILPEPTPKSVASAGSWRSWRGRPRSSRSSARSTCGSRGYRFEWEVERHPRPTGQRLLPAGRQDGRVHRHPARWPADDDAAGDGAVARDGPRPGPPRQRAGRPRAGRRRASSAACRYDRMQESEADHIGVFLMAFAGLRPGRGGRVLAADAAGRAGAAGLPEFLSDHPSHETPHPRPAGVGPAGAGRRSRRTTRGGSPRRAVSGESPSTREGNGHEHDGGPLLGGGGFFGTGGDDWGPRGPFGAWPGCGCGSLIIILAGILLVCGGLPVDARRHVPVLTRPAPHGRAVHASTLRGDHHGRGADRPGADRHRHRHALHAGARSAPTTGEPILVRLSQMDRPLIFILVFLTAVRGHRAGDRVRRAGLPPPAPRPGVRLGEGAIPADRGLTRRAAEGGPTWHETERRRTSRTRTCRRTTSGTSRPTARRRAEAGGPRSRGRAPSPTDSVEVSQAAGEVVPPAHPARTSDRHSACATR